MKKWTFVALLLIGATILGATVLREPMASAASAVLNTNIISPLDASGNVAVHEQGTAKVNVTNATVPVGVQGTAATRSANDEVSITKEFSDPNCTGGDLYTVPNDSRLVIEYVSSLLASGANDPEAAIVHVYGETVDILLPLQYRPQGSGSQVASESVHYVVGPGTTLSFAPIQPGTGCDSFVSLGGYLQAL